jgi:cell wall-associated NlpC family hydrolase
VIKAKDAVASARSLIGTPYSELDCINLIKKVIRTTSGGVPNYTTAGSNSLWKSFNSAPKYKDLTWRKEGIAGAKAGMLAFKRNGDDVHHVGLVSDVGTVIHSSSTQGGRGVVETPLTLSEGWNLLGIHRYIDTAQDAPERREEAVTESYKMQVSLQKEDGKASAVVQFLAKEKKKSV